ncbi:MAG TPA: hypothetical protein VHW70_01370 [Edaphobacter sp.]|jgi:hypothetical protein|nr:hypothetical protein [Edaphobacter sp.]
MQPEEPTPTLHVYTNSIQIPMLVLGSNKRRLTAPITAGRLSVSIDNGPWFRATHARSAADDPISLSILLDANGDSEKLIQGVEDAITKTNLLSLRPQDHLSIYGLDCALIPLLRDAAGDESFKVEAEKAFASWDRRRDHIHDGDCEEPTHLWDALTYVASELYETPRLRIVLAVSQGQDTGSRRTWNVARDYAESTSVAIFGLSYVPADAGGSLGRLETDESIISSSRSPWIMVWGTENPFRQVCELSGGLVLGTRPKYLVEALKTMGRTVRERYIVEFPRPSNATSGKHTLRVKAADSQRYFIRSAGIAVPPPDPKVLADPTTVSAGPKDAPEMGTRKILTKPQ